MVSVSRVSGRKTNISVFQSGFWEHFSYKCIEDQTDFAMKSRIGLKVILFFVQFDESDGKYRQTIDKQLSKYYNIQCIVYVLNSTNHIILIM